MKLRIIKYPESSWKMFPARGKSLGIGYERILLIFDFWKYTIRLQKAGEEG